MAVSIMGPMELLMIMVFGGGVPVVMPPLPADAGMMSVAPQECLMYVNWNGVDVPKADSGNSAEALMAEAQVQRFLQEFMNGLEKALNSENAPRDMRQGAEAFLPLVKDLYQRPIVAYLGKIAPEPPGQVQVEAAIVVHCGNRKQSILASMGRIEALIAGGTGMQVNEIDRAGVRFRKFMLPPEAPEFGWGTSGDYLIFSIGANTFDQVVGRLSTRQGPPAWLQDIQQNLAVERPGYVQYINVAQGMELFNMLMPAMTGTDPQSMMSELGLNAIRSIATVQGYDNSGIVSKTQIATIGPPAGILELLKGEPLTAADLAGIPADANLAFVVKMDLEAKVNKLQSLVRAIEPAGAEHMEAAMQSFQESHGFDLREDLLGPLGDVLRVYNSPEEGGLLVTGITLVADVDDAARLKATEEKLIARLKEEFGGYDETVGLREYEFAGRTIRYFSLGREAPLAPAWCLMDNQLVFGLYPQSVKAFLSRGGAGGSLAEMPEVKAMLAGDTPPYVITYQDTHELVRTLYPLAQIFAPVAANELAREGFEFDVATLPSANAILPHLQPSVSKCTATNNGLYFETHETVPGLSSAPWLLLMGAGVAFTETHAMGLGPRYPEAVNNLRMIGIAMHNYHDSYNRLPAAVHADNNGKPLLSWRVHLLPYLEQQALYEQFHLDEPWDSEHNKPLIAQMPDVFKSPGGKPLDEGMTCMVVPTGDDTIFPVGGKGPGKGLSLVSITDGTSNTVMLLEVAPEHAVIWTKPDDWAFDAEHPDAGLIGHRRGGFLALFADAHSQFIREGIPADMLKAIFTRAGGEAVSPWQWDEAGYDVPAAVVPPEVPIRGDTIIIDRAAAGGR